MCELWWPWDNLGAMDSTETSGRRFWTRLGHEKEVSRGLESRPSRGQTLTLMEIGWSGLDCFGFGLMEMGIPLLSHWLAWVRWATNSDLAIFGGGRSKGEKQQGIREGLRELEPERRRTWTRRKKGRRSCHDQSLRLGIGTSDFWGFSDLDWDTSFACPSYYFNSCLTELYAWNDGCSHGSSTMGVLVRITLWEGCEVWLLLLMGKAEWGLFRLSECLRGLKACIPYIILEFGVSPTSSDGHRGQTRTDWHLPSITKGVRVEIYRVHGEVLGRSWSTSGSNTSIRYREFEFCSTALSVADSGIWDLVAEISLGQIAPSVAENYTTRFVT